MTKFIICVAALALVLGASVFVEVNTTNTEIASLAAIDAASTDAAPAF